MVKPHLIANCPKCGNKDTTFDVKNSNECSRHNYYDSVDDFLDSCSPDELCRRHLLFTKCRNCHFENAFIISERYDEEKQYPIQREEPMKMTGKLNHFFNIVGVVRLNDNLAISPPEFMPQNIEQTFKEGIECLSIRCWNAAGGMFRKCLDLTAKDKLAKKDHGKKLSTKIKCLLAEKILSADLEKVANYIILDGNDGLHNRMLTKDEAMILVDFTVLLLGRMYTEPKIIAQIEARREKIKTKMADEAKRAKN